MLKGCLLPCLVVFSVVSDAGISKKVILRQNFGVRCSQNLCYL